MSELEPLTAYLSGLGKEKIPMTFEEIEKVLGAKLPPSAFKHPAWWSNNPKNNSRTYAWLNAGYKTADVDMKGRKLVFRRSGPSSLLLETEGKQLTKTKSGFFLDIPGSLKGTVTISPGVDLISPAGEEWGMSWDK